MSAAPGRRRRSSGGPATLSFHLKELFHARLVTTRQAGRFIYYAANYETMNGLLAFSGGATGVSFPIGCSLGTPAPSLTAVGSLAFEDPELPG